MKISSIKIHNFRSIIDANVSFMDYTLIVGANNSGKSTIIDAIRAFYEKDGFKYKKEHDFPLKGNKDNASWIDIEFELTEEEYESLKDDYKRQNKSLKVRKYFLTNEKLNDGKTASSAIVAYLKDGSLSNEHFYGAKNVQSGKFGNLIYVPAVSKVDDHTKLTGPSHLRDLITNIMSDVVESSDEYKDLSSSISSFAQGIKCLETNESQSLNGFEKELNGLIAPWETNFNIQFATPSTADIIKNMLSWEIKDTNHNKGQKIDYFGSGFQRHFIYSLITLGAKYLTKKPSKKTKDFTPDMSLILFEEPEAFLHPPQQDSLSRSLIQLSQTKTWQALCSTHSSNFVSRYASSIPAIVKTCRTDGITTTFQINDSDWQNIINSNQMIQSIAAKHKKVAKTMQSDDMRPEMESVKYFLWLNNDRSNLFFAKQVLLVEGPSETSFINKLIDDGKIKVPNGTYFLDSMGKYNIHRFMNLLSKLGIKHSVLIDDDNNNAEHADLNKLIIASKHKDYTINIVMIPKDLESLLKIPPAKAKHRKPQHILLCYEDSIITEGNLNNFCNLVESCFN